MTETFRFAKLTDQLLLKNEISKKKNDQQTGGKWLIHGTKHHTEKQLLSLEHSCIIS